MNVKTTFGIHAPIVDVKYPPGRPLKTADEMLAITKYENAMPSESANPNPVPLPRAGRKPNGAAIKVNTKQANGRASFSSYVVW